MIIDISDYEFRDLFGEKEFYLPIRWTGGDFHAYLKNLFQKYRKRVKGLYSFSFFEELKDIDFICYKVLECIKNYLNGFPSKAFSAFKSLMKSVSKNPLRVYNKSSDELVEGVNDPLQLFRVASVKENVLYDRKRLFHTPYNLRSKVPTCRYSIAGYPSLYLGTDLALCCEEIRYDPYAGFGIAARFQLERNRWENNTTIRVIELALKPQDFFSEELSNQKKSRRFGIDLRSNEIRTAYLFWYPIIAACSFIRVNKDDPFAAEYIIPQLLMQWVRSEMGKEGSRELIGIRYFSCASERASDMGFNYVFPVSGEKDSEDGLFCPILMGAFKLTKPYFINNYNDIEECRWAMIGDYDLRFLNEE